MVIFAKLEYTCWNQSCVCVSSIHFNRFDLTGRWKIDVNGKNKRTLRTFLNIQGCI